MTYTQNLPPPRKTGRPLQTEKTAGALYARLTLKRGSAGVSGNVAASQILGLDFPALIKDLPFDGDIIRKIETLVFNRNAATGDQIAMTSLHTCAAAGAVQTGLLYISPGTPGLNNIEIMISHIAWPPHLLKRLSEALGLTPGEGQILEGFLNNLTQKQIAEMRGRSVTTIRTQSRMILQKTGCARMSDVVQMAKVLACMMPGRALI